MTMAYIRLFCLLLLGGGGIYASLPQDVQARTWMVGPEYSTKTLRDAIGKAHDGDTIGIMAGLYNNDFVTITQNNLTIEGIGGYAHFKATRPIPNRKAIWVVRGHNITVRNIEFSGAKVPDRNGAGIRFETGSLTLEKCSFHDNEMGILSGNDDRATLHISQSEFRRNIQDYPVTGKLSHNIYVGKIARFILDNSVSRGAKYGHAVKSRARENIIRNSRIFDEGDISASYLIELPNGGVGHIENNYFYRNAGHQNNVVISYGAEGMHYPENKLFIKFNYVKSQNRSMFLLRNHSKLSPRIIGNELVNILANEAPGFEKDGFWYRMKEQLLNRLSFAY